MKQEYNTREITSVNHLQDEVLRVKGLPNDLLYRGQASDKPLIPSLFRAFQSKNMISVQDLKGVLDHELKAVAYFAIQADQMGFHLPGDNSALLNIDRCLDLIASKWRLISSNPWIQTIALAQHHGLDTRLLDFTYRPEVALFFAARAVCSIAWNDPSVDLNTDNRSFVLWLVDSSFYWKLKGIHRVQVGYASNPYLRAQCATFLAYDLPETRDDKSKLELSAFDLVKRMVRANPFGQRDRLIKYTIPYKLAPELLMRLDAGGCNLMSVMPSMDNVKQHWNERDKKLPSLIKLPQDFNMGRLKFI